MDGWVDGWMDGWMDGEERERGAKGHTVKGGRKVGKQGRRGGRVETVHEEEARTFLGIVGTSHGLRGDGRQERGVGKGWRVELRGKVEEERVLRERGEMKGERR
eukprot:1009104-Rhodomonas_salina.1